MAQNTTSKAMSRSATGRAYWIQFAAGWIGGALLVRHLPGTFAARVLGGLLAGALIGLLPYFMAKSRGHLPLGQKALLYSSLSGAVLGVLLATPVALAFTFVAMSRTAQDNPNDE